MLVAMRQPGHAGGGKWRQPGEAAAQPHVTDLLAGRHLQPGLACTFGAEECFHSGGLVSEGHVQWSMGGSGGCCVPLAG